MGNLYKNDMFVADAINGNIYHFKLTPQRTGLIPLKGPLADGVANSSDSLDQILFGQGFGKSIWWLFICANTRSNTRDNI
jgi:hypothetical protein